MARRARQQAAPEGAYQRWLNVGLFWLMPFMVVALVMAAQFRGLEREPAIEQAVVARRWSQGHGFTTGVILPRSLAYNQSLETHPELRCAPLSVLPQRILLGVLQQNPDRAVVYGSMLAWLLAVWLTVIAATVLHGPAAGRLAGFLVTFAPALLALAISADGRTWAMPLLLLLWLVLAAPMEAMQRAVAAGFLLGLLWLTNYGLVLPLLLAVLPALVWRRAEAQPPRAAADATDATTPEPPPAPTLRTPGAALVAGLVALLVVTPWLIRNQRVAGTPLPGLGTYQIMTYSEALPGRSIERIFVNPGASPAGFLTSHKKQVARKLTGGLFNLRSALPDALEWLVLALFLASLFQPASGGRGQAQRALVWAVLYHAALLTWLGQRYSELTIWLPLLIVFSAGWVGDRLTGALTGPARLGPVKLSAAARRGWAATLLVLALAAPGLGPQLFSAPPLDASPSAPNHKLLQLQLGEGEVVVTDDPWTVAWELGAPALWLPQSPADLQAIEEHGRLKMIYFTRGALPAGGRFAPGEVGPWWSWAQTMPTGFLQYRPFESRVPGERLLINTSLLEQPGQ